MVNVKCLVKDIFNMIKAKFRGRSTGGGGYAPGHTYNLKISVDIEDRSITIIPSPEELNIVCFIVNYPNWEKFNENWDIAPHIKIVWDAFLK